MFKLIVAVIVFAGGQPVDVHYFSHRDRFESEKACNATYTASKPQLREILDPQFPDGMTYELQFACEREAPSTTPQDRAADGIASIFRAMIRQGGFGGGNSPR